MTIEEERQCLRLTFPALFLSPFEITSPQAIDYNCIAWAGHCSDAWWWPGGPYWPDGVPRSETITAFCEAYGTMGYQPCADGEYEAGFEKVALYASAEGRVLHAARQLADRKWTSKLGEEWDITHELQGLEGDAYGTVARFLKRPATQGSS